MDSKQGLLNSLQKGHRIERRKGGIISMPFIFANEICEKLAVVGFGANMISYLTLQLHLPLTKAANTLTNFGGTASMTPLLGAFIADAYAGRFWTITVASVIYQKGMISLTVSAVLSKLRPPPCKGEQVCQEANSGQLAILYISLLLTAIGSGGIRPCVVAFGAEQFDETDPKQKTATWKFFNWYYFCMRASMLVAVTVVVYIQDNMGWGWGLGVPTVAMALSVIAFIIGYPLYRHMDPAGSPFTRLIQVSVAAYRKRNLPMNYDPDLLYENQELDASISLAGELLHTKLMRFLDIAAIVTSEDNIISPNLWRLNTVHRVEELKSVIRMGPIWAAGIILITAYAQQGTFSLQQAKTMDRHLTNSFQIPAGSMQVFTLASMLTTIIIYDLIFIPIIRKFTGLERGISFLINPHGNRLFHFNTGNISTIVVWMVHKFSAGADGSNWLPNNNLNKGKLEYFYWLITLLQAVNLVYYIFCAKFYTFKPIQVHTVKDECVMKDGVELRTHA